MGGFRDLIVWQKARVYRNECAMMARTFPPEEKYRLIDQLIRSSRAISAHIAEGHGRYHYKENIQLCRTGRGELSESIDHLTVALDEQYIGQNEFERMEQLPEELERILNGYIAHLQESLRKAST